MVDVSCVKVLKEAFYKSEDKTITYNSLLLFSKLVFRLSYIINENQGGRLNYEGNNIVMSMDKYHR